MNCKHVALTALALCVLFIGGCVPAAPPQTSPPPPTKTPTALQVVSSELSDAIVRHVTKSVLDDRLKVTVQDGIEQFIARNPGCAEIGWQVYFVKNYHVLGGSERPGEPIYWAVWKVRCSSEGLRAAVFAVWTPGGEFSEAPYPQFVPCTELADFIASRVFGGPSYETMDNRIFCIGRGGAPARILDDQKR